MRSEDRNANDILLAFTLGLGHWTAAAGRRSSPQVNFSEEDDEFEQSDAKC